MIKHDLEKIGRAGNGGQMNSFMGSFRRTSLTVGGLGETNGTIAQTYQLLKRHAFDLRC